MEWIDWEDHNHTALLKFPLHSWKSRKKSSQVLVLQESGRRICLEVRVVPSLVGWYTLSGESKAAGSRLDASPTFSIKPLLCSSGSSLLSMQVFIVPTFSPVLWKIQLSSSAGPSLHCIHCILFSFFFFSSCHYLVLFLFLNGRLRNPSFPIFPPFLSSSVSKPQGQLAGNVLCKSAGSWRKQHFFLLISLSARKNKVEWNISFIDTQRPDSWKDSSPDFEYSGDLRFWGLYP